MTELPHTIVCEGCDAVYDKPELQPRDVVKCPRCGAELDRHSGDLRQRILPLTVASLIMFAIANLFPIVEIELQGKSSQTTLLGAVQVLAHEGMSLVALLVLATTLLFPLLQLCILAWLLVPLAKAKRAPGFSMLVRAIQTLRPWGMIEVFLLGVLVAIIKLSSMATVVAGPALWAFMALTVLLTAVLSFDPRGFWQVEFDPELEQAA